MKKCLNNRSNHENLDSLHFFSKTWQIILKIRYKDSSIFCFLSLFVVLKCELVWHCVCVCVCVCVCARTYQPISIRVRVFASDSHPNWRFQGQRQIRSRIVPPPASAGPPADGRWCHWQASHSTWLLGLVQAMSRHMCWILVIYRVIPSPAVGSSGSHCSKLADDQHTFNRTRTSVRTWPPLPKSSQ